MSRILGPHAVSTTVLLAALCLAAGCSDEKASTKPSPDIRGARQIPAEYQTQVDQLVAGNTAFALDLYAELKGEAGNLFFSPYSISTAMAMIWAGARDQTETEVAAVFHFPYGQAGLHQTFGQLQHSLRTGIGYELYRLDIANRLWGQTGYPWSEPFLEITRVDYEAELQEADIAADQEAVRLAINAWVRDQTAGKIPNLLTPGLITPLTRLVLANAIYFKGTWVKQFDAAKTKDEPFWLSAASSAEVPMMHQTERFGYAKHEGVTVLEMPYNGQDISMVVLLPDSVDGLADLESRLTPDNLASWLNQLIEPQVIVAMPRFTFRWKSPLAEPLTEMGMPSIFIPEAADLTGMATVEQLYLQFLVHEAYVAVDEEGTTAAAATAGGSGATSAPNECTVNHPFLFLIRDRVTGSILFLGRVMDPRG